MGTPSPMHQPDSSRDYERLLRREIVPADYLETLKREVEADVRRALTRRRKVRAAA